MNILDAIVNAKGGAAGAAGSLAGLGRSGGGIAALLPLLDRRGEGSMVGDVTSMIGRFMKGS